ncbi:MAG TPA: tRNA lysidine(34) synthetase TilS [Solirubrobacteraceae bacterium]|nr:tRNA lysidine(34) synthetase TilS [Solirubrobacteraceae bacterium]
MVEEVRERVRAGGLLPADAQVVAMLSGGRDSVCLLDLAVALCGAEKVHVLHVNYGLRPEAAGDEEHCRLLCEQLRVGFDVVRAERARDATGNLHAWAREIRYATANRLAGPRRALIAVGHTATDQVETILYRLAASPGRRALLGMPECEQRLVRPLLGLTREQTACYCRDRELAWREDESNDRLSYARARVRNQLLPAFEEVHPAAPANLLRTAMLLREETDLLDALVETELKGERQISIERLAELPPALARLVVIRMAEDVAGSFVPQAGDRVQELLALADASTGAELHVGGLVAAVIVDGTVRMKRIASRMG